MVLSMMDNTESNPNSLEDVVPNKTLKDSLEDNKERKLTLEDNKEVNASLADNREHKDSLEGNRGLRDSLEDILKLVRNNSEQDKVRLRVSLEVRDQQQPPNNSLEDPLLPRNSSSAVPEELNKLLMVVTDTSPV